MIDIKLVNLGKINQNEVLITTDKGSLVLFFSYETIVGFRQGISQVISENVWSKTTGKLLNDLEPDKKLRYDHDKFKARLEQALKEI